MTPLYRDPVYTFRFADDRRVDRFRVEGVEPGRRVTVHRLEGETPGDVLARGHAGADGWVELPVPLVVRAGEGFVAVADTT